MKKTDFFELVTHPERLNEETLPALSEIVQEFPWFQAARMLLLKNLHTIEHVRFNGELKQSAAYIADRKKLFELIHYTAKASPVIETIEPAEEEHELVAANEASAIEHQTESRPKKTIGITTRLSSINNYFQTDDTFETEDGDQIDFSVFSNKKTEEKESNSMVMPSADFLGYESNQLVGYELKESINPEEKKDESHSFSDWLTMLRHAPVEPQEQPVKKKSQQIIDNFLRIETPKIVPPVKQQTETEPPTEPTEEVDNGDDLLSETLANIYIRQKHYDKAIGIYEKLRLKYPEKNVYFARRIDDLEKLTN
ncbi:tetratricopeptide repeat protein [Carboxylicivirga taeanensis]|uniref:tetratricopeptide repeat protein n=1 Tax=Carboxylicivirga taeanensis TaxID=1416875 RepID=UPI003F6DE6D1